MATSCTRASTSGWADTSALGGLRGLGAWGLGVTAEGLGLEALRV